MGGGGMVHYGSFKDLQTLGEGGGALAQYIVGLTGNLTIWARKKTVIIYLLYL